MQKPADDVSYSLDPASRVGPIERFRIFHTDPLFVRCVQERRHATVPIIGIRPDSTYPSPTKVFDQLCQRVSLELVTRDGSEETGVLLLIRQACTGGKVTNLEENNSLFNRTDSKMV